MKNRLISDLMIEKVQATVREIEFKPHLVNVDHFIAEAAR